MIAQVAVQLEKREVPYGASLGYPLYAWLLSMVPGENGDRMHEQGIHPISQYVRRDFKTEEDWWIVNLLNDEAVDLFLPILERAQEAALHHKTIRFVQKKIERIKTAQEFIERARFLPDTNRYELWFTTPTSFKQDGRYVIFPQEFLLLQSLISRWNLCFPEIALDDSEAVQAMLRGLHITDYKLQTLRHPMKQTRIPSFTGKLVLETRLPAPLAEVFRTLYCFAPYAGVGIKTTLGMGGVQVSPSKTLRI